MKENIAILLGGQSVEHEVSIITGLQVYDNLNKGKYNAHIVYISRDGKWNVGKKLNDINTYKNKDFKEVFQVNPIFENGKMYLVKKKRNIFDKLKKNIQIDVVFPALHGTNGEDGAVHGMCQMFGVPCCFGTLLSNAIGMDKITMKRVFVTSGLNVVPFVWFYNSEFIDNENEIINICEEIGYPMIVKPSNLGSSIGISTVYNRDDLVNAIKIAGFYDNKILVEKYIEGAREINCAVLGEEDNVKVSYCEEPYSVNDILTFNDKYLEGYKEESSEKRIIPAKIGEEIVEKIYEISKKAFRAIDCSGNARVDLLLSDNKVFVNEINTIPGSISFYLWEKMGLNFSDLLTEIIEIAKKICIKNKNKKIENAVDLLGNLGKNIHK